MSAHPESSVPESGDSVNRDPTKLLERKYRTIHRQYRQLLLAFFMYVVVIAIMSTWIWMFVEDNGSCQVVQAKLTMDKDGKKISEPASYADAPKIKYVKLSSFDCLRHKVLVYYPLVVLSMSVMVMLIIGFCFRKPRQLDQTPSVFTDASHPLVQ